MKVTGRMDRNEKRNKTREQRRRTGHCLHRRQVCPEMFEQRLGKAGGEEVSLVS